MKLLAPIVLVVLAGVVIAASICQPALLAKNDFLDKFINHELLNVLAVIVTITIATIATIHIWFNELEQKHQKKVFDSARREINSSATWLVGMFLFTLALLIARSLDIFSGDPARSFFNGAGVIVLVASVLVLMDILAVVRALTPKS